MIVNTDVDIKHYYRFIEYVAMLNGISLPHERFKLIALDNYKAESENELLIKRFSEAYLFLINNKNQILTKEIIIKAYYLLTNKIIEDNIAKSILSTYYENYDEASHYLAGLIHLVVLDKVAERKIEFAFMISNLIMLKKGRYVLIPYEFNQDEYNEIIQNRDIAKLTIFFGGIERYVSKTLLEPKEIEFDELIDKLKECKAVLRNKYHVRKLFLYGSYAKRKVSSVSDLDLLVIFSNDLLNFQRIQTVELMEKYLLRELEIKVDLLDFTHAMEKLNISEMENIITII